MGISSWEPSELDKQTQIAQQSLARIAELEAEIVIWRTFAEKSERNHQQAQSAHNDCIYRAEVQEMRLVASLSDIEQLNGELGRTRDMYRELNLACNDHITRWQQAEAALAERDRMLEMAIDDMNFGSNRRKKYEADLRVRAEEGGGDER